MTRLQIKICGVHARRGRDASRWQEGADLIGVDPLGAQPARDRPRRRAARARGRARRRAARRRVRRRGARARSTSWSPSIGLDRVQLHGAEPRAEILRYGERAFRGVRDGDASAVPDGRAGRVRRAVLALGEHARARGALGAARAARRRPSACCSRAPRSGQRRGRRARGAAVRRRLRARRSSRRPASRTTIGCGASSPRPGRPTDEHHREAGRAGHPPARRARPVRALRRALRARDRDGGARRARGRRRRGVRPIPSFAAERDRLARDYVGRPTPIYLAERLTARRRRRAHLPEARGPRAHGRAQDQQRRRPGADRRAPRQAADRRGDRRGPARRRSATVCARFGMECIVYMGEEDTRRQRPTSCAWACSEPRCAR